MWRAAAAGILGIISTAAACNQIANIDGGLPLDEDEEVSTICSSIADCKASVPECRTAIACEQEVCVFEDAAEGTPLPTQTPGDCAEVVCDGAGKSMVVAAASDAPDDDGKVCTLDACSGTTPVHTVVAEAACYTGPEATKGKGSCAAGVQKCTAGGDPVGTCEGQVLPKAEACEPAGMDEDCDGQVNEEGAGCVCGDGYLSLGEECEDGGTLGGDGCSATCEKEVATPAAGGNHTCAVLYNGKVKCWGRNKFGELGLGDTSQRGDGPNEMGPNLPVVDLGIGETAKAIRGGYYHTCALLASGSVKCWGWNGIGQLGLGDTSDRGDAPNEMGDNLSAIDLGMSKTATAIAAGGSHTCALLNNGSVKCWGDNTAGQLGLGNTMPQGSGPMGDNLPAIDLGSGKTAIAIAAGYTSTHTCALLNNGSVKCWGENSDGQLGQGNTARHGDGPNEMGEMLPEIYLGTGTTATAIAVGSSHTCALLNDGSVKCWGSNTFGQLGLGDTSKRGDGPSEMGNSLPAVNLGTGRTATTIAAGGLHTCALLDNGSIRCWGRNNYGQLGLGDTSPRGDQPNEMGDNLPAIDLGSGVAAATLSVGYEHGCARLNDGRIKCWGLNVYGQLGLEDTSFRGDQPNEMGDNLPTVKLFP